jgi:hypothetical protein
MTVTRTSMLGCVLGVLFAGIAGCHDEPRRPVASDSGPASIELRHRFVKGRTLRYDSKTVERGTVETTIDMQYLWTETGVRPSGEGEVEISIARYQYRVFPTGERGTPLDARVMNEKLVGASFRLLVSPDGHDVQHLGVEGLPDITPASVEALRLTLTGHVLRLPADHVVPGKRWTVEHRPAPDAGPGALHTENQWRVLSVRRVADRQVLDLVCLSVMTPQPMRVEGRRVVNRTEFHYAYQWSSTEGILEGLTSRGETEVRTETAPDSGVFEEPRRVRFEGTLRLVDRR